MEIYLVRHGETESNKEKKYQGWMDSPLSAQGLVQAEKAALFLGGKKIEAVFCSDLQRALHTARVIGSSCGLVPEITPLLREINFGRWEGLTYEEIEAHWGYEVKRWFDDPFKRSAPGGETIKQVCERMVSFLDGLLASNREYRRIAAVSHGGAIRALLQHVLRLDRDNFWNLKINNASISLVRREGEKFVIAYLNRINHLEEGEIMEEYPDGF